MRFKKSILSFAAAVVCISMAGASDTDFDVVIVGGGLAGLNAARAIHQADPTVRLLLLEGRDRLGGRTCTLNCNGINVEAGGEFIEREEFFIQSTLDELGIGKDPVRLNGEIFIVDQDQKVLLADFMTHIGTLKDKLKQAASQLKQEDYVKFNEVHNQWIYAATAPCLELTREERLLLSCIVRDEYGIDYEKVSLSCLASLIDRLDNYQNLGLSKSTPIVSFLANTFFDHFDYQYRIQGGTKVLVQALASKVPPGAIRTEACLTRVSYVDDLYQLQMKNGQVLRSKKVIMATPFSVLRSEYNILDDKSLNICPEMRLLIDSMPYGTNSKLIMPVQQMQPTSYVLNLNYGGMTAWGNPAGITWMLGGSIGAALTLQSPCITEIRNQMPQLLSTKPQHIGDPIVVNWSQDPFSCGSYSTVTEGMPYVDLSDPSDTLPGLCKFASARNNTLFFIGEQACDGQTKCDENKGNPISPSHMQSALYSGYVVGKFLTQSTEGKFIN